ncbi:hypothetical protein WJX72_008331 [[Myrmecia] bisecta]|uniref:Uncharacterized protein n=1 Tax=[Myrmecia] bisecta TaxID=41462 RepID=A0AAW1PXD3_9CHLO
MGYLNCSSEGCLGKPSDFPPPEAAAHADSCAAALQLPKVALMFLTRGDLYHEPTWRLWFQYAANLVPLDAVRAGQCSADRLHAISQHCASKRSGSDALAQQHLFNVYIHSSPDWPGYPKGNIFRGRELTQRVNASWGTHALIDATRLLIAAALRDPNNHKLVLLSEAVLPLFPPTLIYQQLMTEDKSRVNACEHEAMNLERWHPNMTDGRFTKADWRKSSQWVALTRHHAAIARDDTYLNAIFQRWCYSRKDPLLAKWYDCYSDEHYIPSLLAYNGETDAADCAGKMVHVDWSMGGPHPMTYAPDDITADRFMNLRSGDGCHAAAAMRLVGDMVLPANQVTMKQHVVLILNKATGAALA